MHEAPSRLLPAWSAQEIAARNAATQRRQAISLGRLYAAVNEDPFPRSKYRRSLPSGPNEGEGHFDTPYTIEDEPRGGLLRGVS